MRTRNWIALLLAMLCAIGFCACQKDEPKDEPYAFVVDGVKVIPGEKASGALGALASRNPSVSAKGSCLGGVDGEDVNYVYQGFRIQTFRLSEGDANEEIRWITFMDDSIKTEEGIAIGATVEAVKEAYGEPAETTGGTLIYRRGGTELRFGTRDGVVSGISYTVSE
jgi:hypothetical protein